jgi:hypothetical protein
MPSIHYPTPKVDRVNSANTGNHPRFGKRSFKDRAGEEADLTDLACPEFIEGLYTSVL